MKAVAAGADENEKTDIFALGVIPREYQRSCLTCNGKQKGKSM
jgi:hypothetical protein